MDPRRTCGFDSTHLPLENYLRNLYGFYNNYSLLKVGGGHFQREYNHLIFELLGFLSTDYSESLGWLNCNL